MFSICIPLFLFCAHPAIDPGQASFYAMGILPGGEQNGSFARGMSPDGSVVVGGSYSARGLQAVRWSINSGLTPLPDFADGKFAETMNDASSHGSTMAG